MAKVNAKQPTSRSSSSSTTHWGVVNVVLATLLAVTGYFACVHPRIELPPHMLGHDAAFFPDFLSADEAQELRDEMARIGTFPTNNRDTDFYTPLHEHVGEIRERSPTTGACPHALLVPTKNRTHCVLPGRIDIAQHFLTYGGVAGMKERFDDAVDRLLSYGVYLFNHSAYPIATRLFNSRRFQDAARRICPPHKQFLDPFQWNIILQVPGQSVATHVDGVYFWGASRFQFPQWLLAVMKFSGLFEREFVDQIQVVAYFHSWNDTEHRRSSDFVYWNENNVVPKRVHPYSLAGSIVDGSKTVHAASLYMPEVKAPHVDKDRDVRLEHAGNDRWLLKQDDDVVRTYDGDALRRTLVYRARCFADESERDRYVHETINGHKTMQLDDVLRTLADEMQRRGYGNADALLAMDRAEFVARLLKAFVRYPLPPHALIPFNYCGLAKLYPWLKPVINVFCS